MTPSPALVEFIKGWEGCKLYPYQDSAGLWTIGWGHLLPPSDMRGEITQAEADAMLAADLEATNRGLEMAVTSDPSQQQWDALLSVSYNEGVRAIRQSTLMMHVNRSEWEQAAYEFPRWRYEHKGGKLVESKGLLDRRLAEQAIFLSGNYAIRP